MVLINHDIATGLNSDKDYIQHKEIKILTSAANLCFSSLRMGYGNLEIPITCS